MVLILTNNYIQLNLKKNNPESVQSTETTALDKSGTVTAERIRHSSEVTEPPVASRVVASELDVTPSKDLHLVSRQVHENTLGQEDVDKPLVGNEHNKEVDTADHLDFADETPPINKQKTELAVHWPSSGEQGTDGENPTVNNNEDEHIQVFEYGVYDENSFKQGYIKPSEQVLLESETDIETSIDIAEVAEAQLFVQSVVLETEGLVTTKNDITGVINSAPVVETCARILALELSSRLTGAEQSLDISASLEKLAAVLPTELELEELIQSSEEYLEKATEVLYELFVSLGYANELETFKEQIKSNEVEKIITSLYYLIRLNRDHNYQEVRVQPSTLGLTNGIEKLQKCSRALVSYFAHGTMAVTPLH